MTTICSAALLMLLLINALVLGALGGSYMTNRPVDAASPPVMPMGAPGPEAGTSARVLQFTIAQTGGLQTIPTYLSPSHPLILEIDSIVGVSRTAGNTVTNVHCSFTSGAGGQGIPVSWYSVEGSFEDIYAQVAAAKEWDPYPVACTADIDRDGLVGGTDLAALLGRWGDCDPRVFAEIAMANRSN